MSSYYTTAQLEEIRKEKLRQELADSINKITKQLQIEHQYDSGSFRASNILVSKRMMYSRAQYLTFRLLKKQ